MFTGRFELRHTYRGTLVRETELLKDEVSGLSSQWHFEILFDFIFPIAHRGVNVALVIFGIDKAPGAEDEPSPPEHVAELGAAIGKVTRSTDLVARFEDELFICLLPLCNVQGGLIFADRIRDAIVDFRSETGVTVSAGVTSYRGDQEVTKEDMLEAVRGALASAHDKGGDRIEITSHAWSR